jgi:hypothetical protein
VLLTAVVLGCELNGIEPDYTKPEIEDIYPVDGAVDVAVNTSISITFTEPLLASTINTHNFRLIEIGTETETPIGVEYDSQNDIVILRPEGELLDNTAYEVRIGANPDAPIEDLSGNFLEMYESTFTTVDLDLEAPFIQSIYPGDGEENVDVRTVISVTFSEQMDSQTINSNNIFIQLNGVTIESQVQYDSLNLEARISLSDFLLFNTEYTVTVTTGVSDLAGNPLAIDEIWAFHTEPERPIKILFALDCSGSMGAAGQGADPDNLRMDAALEFVEHYIGSPNYSFDILLWNQDVFSSTSGYTQNIDEIRPIFENFDNTGTTDFVNTIHEIDSDIYTDISNAIDSDNQDLLSHTQYVVLFFSDGIDYVPTTSGEPRVLEILNAVDDLNDMGSDRGVGRFAFHTFFLNGPVMTPEDVDEATDLLHSMANTGQGEFRIFESAEDIDFINTVEITPLED